MQIPPTLSFLLSGDTAIQFQTHRDLLAEERPDLQKRIATEGWGAAFLSKRNKNGHWGQKYYQPKWNSTHYTLLDLRNLCLPPEQPQVRETLEMVMREEKGPDGGILPIGSVKVSDVCVNGMFLNFASYFKAEAKALESVVDMVLSQLMPDGGFNCRSNRSGAVHSSLHSTISVLEGITEYKKNGYTYRLPELLEAQKSSVEFILLHKLFRSDHTGKVIDNRFLALRYPCRWRYDILRALDYFRYAAIPWDERMQDAIDVLLKKQKPDGTWSNPARHAGQVHFDMEATGKPGRWNTLRALRVLKYFKKQPSNLVAN